MALAESLAECLYRSALLCNGCVDLPLARGMCHISHVY